ncbi:MAG: MurR/RpiR family transcriptional regulator [Pseudolabrys sp.]|nr:MurR/RpiR family transcriptional regulator [Pseudolabrys sp.]
MAGRAEKSRNARERDPRAGYSFSVSKAPEDIISVIKQTAPELRPSERRVADVILADVNFALHSANGELARRAGVSEPTVTRFSRAVGCAGVRELKVKLAQSLVVGRIYLDEPQPVRDTEGKHTVWQLILDDIHRAINTAERQLVVADFERAAEVIASCRKLITIGVGGGSTTIANEAKHRFFRLGVAVSNYSDGHLMRMVAATLEKKDVVLAISATGKPKEIIDAVTIAREYGATVIAVTKPNSPLAMAADISLGLYVPETPHALKPTSSRYAFLAAVDLLAALTAYRSPRETQERMRRIKYALGNFGGGDAEGPLGD